MTQTKKPSEVVETAVKMSGITMRFGDVVANDDVNFDVRCAEVHALVGENGAGKTTLMNILYGLYVPTAGTVEIWGQAKQFGSAIDAIRAGVGMVHQHFMLIPQLSVADNIVLGEEPKKGLTYLRRRAVQQVEALCREYDIVLDPKAIVSTVSLGTQQRIEIMKALYRKAEIIILDEPTAVLTPQEIDDLGHMLQQLKKMGKTIIIITHKLQEVINFSDRVTVLRRGKIVETVNTSETSADEITQMMVGRNVHLGGHKQSMTPGEEVLQLKNLCYHNGRVEKLKDVSFSLHKGEIFGIAGIDNSGQREISEAINGIIRVNSGSILLQGEDITKKRTAAIKHSGVGFVPQDRQRSGLAMGMSIEENLILGYQNTPAFRKNGFLLNQGAIEKSAGERIEKFDIRPTQRKTLVKTLSGGNQQKVVVAREVSQASCLIVADQPSRGVDIGAIELIHQALVDARNSGMAVLLISLELDEVMLLSDRIGVMYDGRLMGILDAANATREQIGLMMAGGGVSDEKQ